MIAAILSLIRPGQVDLGSQREVKNDQYCYTFGRIPRNFKTSMKAKLTFWGKITKIILRVNSRFFTKSTYIWFFRKIPKIIYGRHRINLGMYRSYNFCNLPSKMANLGLKPKFWIFSEFSLFIHVILFKDVISRTSPNYERLWSNACWYVEYWNHIRMVHHEFYRIIIHYHNYVTLSKYSCKTNSTDNVWFYLNTLPSGSVARSGSRPMDYIYQWLFSVVCILESRKKGHKSAEFVTFN